MKYDTAEQLKTFHKEYEGSAEWRLTKAGIEVKGAGATKSEIPQTKGKPITVERIWDAYHVIINRHAQKHRVPVELIVAIIAATSRGDETKVTENSLPENPLSALRAGLMQDLVFFPKEYPGDYEARRDRLLIPEEAIKAGTARLAGLRGSTGFDPVLVAAGYRAGEVKQHDDADNKFKLRQWQNYEAAAEGDFCAAFVEWFNDFWSIIRDSEVRPSVSLWEDFNGALPPTYFLPLDLETGLKPTLENLGKYYKHTEQDFPGGYFPVGSNTTWHGGLHLLGPENATVHAVADGVVVLARMPASDPEDLQYGTRNFVLIRHGSGENVWYSLYYHLKSVKPESEEAEKITWLGQEELEFSTPTALWRIKQKQGETPSPKDRISRKHIHTFRAGDFATIVQIDPEDENYYYVSRPDGSGANNKGYVYFFDKLMSVVSRSDRVLQNEEVIRLNTPVKAGDVIGILGTGVTLGDPEQNEGSSKKAGQSGQKQVLWKPILHWGIISPRLRPGFLETVDDDDEDFVCDSSEIIKLVDDGLDQADKLTLTANEIEKFFADEDQARKLRPIACKFRSEWSIDWAAQKDPLTKQSRVATVEALSPYNFWDTSKGIDGMLPAKGHVWHYNPITYLHRQLFRSARANFSREMFEKNSTFLLPEKAISLLWGISEYGGDNVIKTAYIIGHKGVEGDSGDAAELSKARAEAVAAMLTLDEAKINEQIDNGHWGDRERRLMLRWLKTDDGAPYYQGSITKDDPTALEAAVKAFQRANDLDATGNADKATFAKMFERMLDIAGIEPFQSVKTIGAGEVHAKAKCRPEDCVVEGLFWTTDVEPAPDQYDQSPEATYKEWQALIRVEIGPGVPRGNTTEILLRRYGLSERWLKDGTLRDLADGQHLEPDSYVYLFKNGHLWREFKVGEASKLQEVDLGRYYGQDERPACGDESEKLELPHPGKNEEMKVEIALAPVQWSWSRVYAFGGLSDNDPRKGEGDPDITRFDDKKRAERLTLIDTALKEGESWCSPEQFLDREDLRVYVDTMLPVCHVDAPFSLAADSNALVQDAIGDLNERVAVMEEHEHYKSAALTYQLFFNTALHATVAGDDDEYLKQDDNSELLRDCADDMDKVYIEGVLQVSSRKRLRQEIRSRLAAHASLLAGCRPPESAGQKTGGRLTEVYPDLITFEAAFEDYAYLTGPRYAFVRKAFTEHAGNLNFDPAYLDKGNDLHETIEDETDHLSPGSWYLDEVLTSNERLKSMLFPKEDAIDCFSPEAFQPKEITGPENIENADFRPDAFAAAIAEIAKAKDGPVGTGMGYKSSEAGIKIVDKILSEFLSIFTKQVQEEIEAGTTNVREKVVGVLKGSGLPEYSDLHMVGEGSSANGKEFIGASNEIKGNISVADEVKAHLVNAEGKARQAAIAVPDDSLLVSGRSAADQSAKSAPKWATLGGKALPTSIAVLEIFNLYVAWTVVGKSRGSDDWLKAGHALFSVGVALTEAATAIKGAYFENLATHGKGLGRGFGKFATGQFETSLARYSQTPGKLSFIKLANGKLSIIGAIFAFHDASKFNENHDHDAAQASVFSGIAQLWLGLATMGMLPGAAPALAVAMIAMVLVIWLSESELERWAKYGPFAKGGLGDYYLSMSSDEIYAALLSLVRNPRVELKHTTVDETILGGPSAVPRLKERIDKLDEDLNTLRSSLTTLKKQTQVPPETRKTISKALTEALNRGREERASLEKRIRETEKRLSEFGRQHGSVSEDTEIMALEVHAPAWTLSSSIDVQVTSARVKTDVTLLERVGTPFPGEHQLPVDLYLTEDIHAGGGSKGPVIGKRYYFRGKPSTEDGYAIRYRARVRHTVEEGIVLPILWPQDKDKFIHPTAIDYDAPGWIYPDKVLDL